MSRARSAAQLSRRPSSACSVANSTWSEVGSVPYPQGALPGALPQNTGGLRSVTLLDIEQGKTKPDDPEYMLYRSQMRGPGSGYNQTFHAVSKMVASNRMQTSLGKPTMTQYPPSFRQGPCVEREGREYTGVQRQGKSFAFMTGNPVTKTFVMSGRGMYTNGAATRHRSELRPGDTSAVVSLRPRAPAGEPRPLMDALRLKQVWDFWTEGVNHRGPKRTKYITTAQLRERIERAGIHYFTDELEEIFERLPGCGDEGERYLPGHVTYLQFMTAMQRNLKSYGQRK